MNDWNIHKLMSGLASEHSIFHSEADFQHALAWHIHTLDPGCRVRLEARFGIIAETRIGKNSFVDLWLPDSRIAVELKFAKDNFETNYEGEKHELRKGAWDVTAYGFVRDIKRLEKLRNDGEIDTGFAVLLSNEPNIWTPPKRNRPAIFDAFRLHENQPPLAGQRNVAESASAKIKKSHSPITLRGSYPISWRTYYNHEGKGRGLFCYLAVEVGA